MSQRIGSATVIFLMATLCSAGTVAGQAGLDSVIAQVRQGELAAARSTLQALRRERFPGVSFSGKTCREKPGYVLMVAAERELAAKDAVIAGNYLRQLSCLQRVRKAAPAEKRSPALLNDFRDLVPERVNECPFALGDPALERSATKFRKGSLSGAWGELLVAACLSGPGSPDIVEASAQLQSAVLGHTGARGPAKIRPAAKPAPVVVPAEPDRVEPVTEAAVVVEDQGALIGESISRQTSPGQIAFNPPQRMRTGQTEVIEVRIQPDAVTTAGMLGSDDIQIEAIGVTPSMSVKLCCGPSADDSPFDIKSLSNERQVVSPGSFTQWVFEVTPRKGGPQVLKLSISAQYLFPDGSVIPKDYPIMTREIQVVVSERGLPVLWLSLGAAAAALLAFWFWSRTRARPARIFVSYRREDSSGWVQGLHDRLAEHFGEHMVFMDLNDIAPGSDFVSTLNHSLKETRVVLVIIGRRWIEARGSDGLRRLDDPGDWVRLEVQKAISTGKRVIPVLVDGAEMPDAKDLPEDIRALGRHQAVKLYPDQFSSGVQMLIQAIDLGAGRKSPAQ